MKVLKVLKDLLCTFILFFLILIRISVLASSGINANIAEGYYSGGCEDAKRECCQSRVGHFQIFYFIF